MAGALSKLSTASPVAPFTPLPGSEVKANLMAVVLFSEKEQGPWLSFLEGRQNNSITCIHCLKVNRTAKVSLSCFTEYLSWSLVSLGVHYEQVLSCSREL